MKKDCFLIIDQGTTGTRAIIYRDFKPIGSAYKEITQFYPHSGWVEHDPEEIVSGVAATAAEVLVSSGVGLGDICAIGLANQRETVVAWDKNTGKPVYNAIVWQCRRTAEFCENLEKTSGDLIYQKTGLRVDAYFSASKIKWIIENVPEAKELLKCGRLCVGNLDTFLMYKFTGGKTYATDYTNASRTMLFNIHTLEWDDDLCRIFGISKDILPDVFPSAHNFGETLPAFGSLPICSVAGDQQAALFGHGCFAAGAGKTTYGTGCFMLMNTGDKCVRSRHGLITTLAASAGVPQYALEGSVFMGGAVVQWLRDGLKLISDAAESEKLALSVESNGGVVLVPAFTGLGAPYWDSDARGIISGLTRGTTDAHIVRAALESIALQVYDIAESMKCDSGLSLSRLKVDGGAAANNFLMQFQADILNCEVARSKNREITSLGACYLAAIERGQIDISFIEESNENDIFVSKMDDTLRNKCLDDWHSTVKKCILQKED